jgi:hypothetical protein
MPRLSVAVAHALPEVEAVARLRHFAAELKERHQDEVQSFHETWNGNQLDFGLTTWGLSIEGVLRVEPQQVVIDAKLPLAAMVVKGKIERSIREELTRLLV